jgi:hypothetical protein
MHDVEHLGLIAAIPSLGRDYDPKMWRGDLEQHRQVLKV